MTWFTFYGLFGMPLLALAMAWAFYFFLRPR